MKPYRLLDLFSGIGGFSLGLERSGGFKTVAFCEIEPFPRRVLAKHWPGVPIYDDVRTLTAERLAADGIGVDAICGGFPCQDISTAGKGAGLDGERSGLWREYARLVGELRPRYVVVENVAALLGRGLDRVLGDLAALGYDAEWHCIPASAVGAPHRRDRVWLVADSRLGRRSGPNRREVEQPRRTEAFCPSDPLANADDQRKLQPEGSVEDLGGRASDGRSDVAHAGRIAAQVPPAGHLAAVEVPQRHPWWEVEPDVGRVAHGVSARVDRLKSLGNAVVPQIPELIGRAIMAAESQRAAA